MILYESAAAFIIMFILIRKRVPLGLSLLAGGVVIGLFGFGSFSVWSKTVYTALLSKTTLDLTAIILLINMLGHAMKEYGTLDRLNIILGKIFPDKRYLMAFFPAAIGMLSVPGGAILSAPIVDNVSRGKNLTPEKKAATNLIFRHFWFLSYPLYTSMIIVNSLTGVNSVDIIKLGLVPTLAGFWVSWKVCFKGWKQEESGKNFFKTKEIYQLFLNISPILITLTASMVFGLNYILSLIIGILFNEFINRLIITQSKIDQDYIKNMIKSFFRNTLLGSLNWQLAIIPLGINFLRLSLETVGVPNTLASLLLNLHFPLEVLLFLMPLLISFLTGIHLASVSISIPLFLSFLSGENLAQSMFLLLTAATVGYWMSPFHLCLILNMQYFKSGYLGTIRLMLWPSLTVATAGIFMYAAMKILN